MAYIEFLNTPLFTSTVAAGTLKFYYRGEDLTDSSGNSKTLTKTGTVDHVAAKINNGFSANFVDNNNNLVNTSVGAPGSGDFTLSCFFKKNGASSVDYTPTILSWANSTGGNSIYLVAAKTTGYLRGEIYVSSSDSIASTTNVCDNTLHMVTFTRIGTATKIYVDAVSVGTGTSSKNSAGAEVHVGFNGASGFDYIGNAIIDEVIGITRGLTATEVSDLYNGNYGGIPHRAYQMRQAVARSNYY